MKTEPVLKTLRERARISQGELGKALGFTSAQFVSNIERGLTLLPTKHYRKAAKLLRCNPWVFADERLKKTQRMLEKALGVSR